MAKIMLVGLGGSGSKIVVEVEKLIGHLPEETRRGITLATLGIDTHNQYLPEIKDPISSLQINTDVVSLVKNIEQFPQIKEFWNPDIRAADTSNGAGGVRILSRVSVFRHAGRIYQRISSALDRLAAIKGEGNIYVLVVSSLFGGTGGGSFIDIANIISNKLQENLAPTDFRIIGHFFLPSILPGHSDRNFENTYASLQEYEFLLKRGKFETSYDRALSNLSVDLPYHNFFLISGFTHDNLTLPHKPEDFYEMAARKIYYEILSQTLFKEFMGKLIDVHVLADSFEYAGGIKKPTAFSAFGISAVSYPYDNIRRYFANKISAGILSSGFLAVYDREIVEKEDVKSFIGKNSLDNLDGQIRQDKELAFNAAELRFDKAKYDHPGIDLDKMSDTLASDYDSMKTTKFEIFRKTVQKRIEALKKGLKSSFLSELRRIVKSYGIVRARVFVELLLEEMSRLEKRYQEEFRKFERISDDATLEEVTRELDDVKVQVRTWWPIFKRKRVMKELDEFIEQVNGYVENNMNEIINKYASRLLADMGNFVRNFYRPGGKHGPSAGFLERVKLQAEESRRRDFENIYKEVGTFIQLEVGRENEYRVIQNLLKLEELENLYTNAKLNLGEAYTLLTNDYMPYMLLDPDKISAMDEESLAREMDSFRMDKMMEEFSNKISDFSFNLFDQRLDVFKVENVIKKLKEEDIVNRIDDMIKYCSPFLGYKRDIANIKRVENALLLIRPSAYGKIKNRVTEKYGANYFFIQTDDVDFLMMVKYVHGYDLNSLTEIESIARKYKALRPEEQNKRHIDNRWFGSMEPILVSDIRVVSDESYLRFALSLNTSIGEDFPVEFGVGRGKVNPKFAGKAIIGAETGIYFKFLDWEGYENEEKEIGRTIIDAFNVFEKDANFLDSISRYEKKFMSYDNRGYKQRLEETWKNLEISVQKLKDSSKVTRDKEIELYRKMMKAIERQLSDMS